MNPFPLNLNKDILFNIGSGKAATSFLLHVTDIGNRACEEFIGECISNPRRFEERIKKWKIHRSAKKGASLEAFYSLLYNQKLIWVKR